LIAVAMIHSTFALWPSDMSALQCVAIRTNAARISALPRAISEPLVNDAIFGS